MRVGVGPLLLGIVTVLARANGYAVFADAMAFAYLALATSRLERAPVHRPALHPVPLSPQS